MFDREIALKQLQALLISATTSTRGGFDNAVSRTRALLRSIFGPETPWLADLKAITDLKHRQFETEHELEERKLAALKGLIQGAIDALHVGSIHAGAVPPAPLLLGASVPSEPTAPAPRIFIVHGWDEGLKSETARLVERLGLEAVVLHEQVNAGRTIIEKLEKHRDVGGAIVLLTPDDALLHQTENGSTEELRRARQNVIAELGFFVGLLGRSRVIVLLKRHPAFDIPSDFLGVAYTEADKAGRWRLDVARELQHAGFAVDLANVP